VTPDLVALAPRHFARINWVGLSALYRRELWRLQKNYLDSLLGPALANLIFVLILRLAVGRGGASAGGLSVTDFVAPGLIMFAAAERAFSAACVSLLFDKLEGMIADVVMAPLSAGERLSAYAGAAVSTGAISALATAAVLSPFAAVLPAHPGTLLFFLLAGSLMIALIGILSGLWASRWEHYAALLAYFLIPFSYLSGMFYPTGSLPTVARLLIAVNPLYYVIDGMRYGVTGFAETALWPGGMLILGLDAGLLALAYRLLGRGWRLKS
jgi:ABC-2 type transport system permease protein